MELIETFLLRTQQFGQLRYSYSFGWICMMKGKRMFGGYKNVDKDILLLWLIVSPQIVEDALESGFQKFDFGKTWVETEITGEEDLDRVWPFINNAVNYSEERSLGKKKK